MAALREVYGGSWDRPVGTDGGRVLRWAGKCGFIGGVTPSYDRYASVVNALGDRYLGLALFPQHAQMLVASGITPEHARARGYVSVDTKRRLEGLGITPAGRNVPGLLVPSLRADGSTWGCQYRPDVPAAPRREAAEAVRRRADTAGVVAVGVGQIGDGPLLALDQRVRDAVMTTLPAPRVRSAAGPHTVPSELADWLKGGIVVGTMVLFVGCFIAVVDSMLRSQHRHRQSGDGADGHRWPPGCDSGGGMNHDDRDDAFASVPPLHPDESLVRRGLVKLAGESGVNPGVMVVTDQRVMIATAGTIGTALVFSAARSVVPIGWPIDGGPVKEFGVATGKGPNRQVFWVRRHPDSPEDAQALFEAIHGGPVPDPPEPFEATPPGTALRLGRWLTARLRRHG